MNKENAIEVKHVSKSFKLYHDKAHQLKDAVVFHNFRNKKKVTKRQILDDISFEVKKGEALALIGRNGCGKSTTLKMLTRILYPDQGSIEIEGRVASLIELGAGFHPDMTGRENIFINASIFGIKAKEVEMRIDDIISFSELEEYIDSPVRTYSSGMYMRLAFAVAINVNADILLIDEILAVGDASFQAKCFKKIRGLKESGVTIVLVSHSLGQVEKICDKVIWIEDGKIREEGETEDVCQHYTMAMDEERIAREREELKKRNEKIRQKREEKEREEQKEQEEQIKSQVPEENKPENEKQAAASAEVNVEGQGRQEETELKPQSFEPETAEEENRNPMEISAQIQQEKPETEEEIEEEEYKIYDNERPFEMMLHNEVADYARIDREVNGKILIQSVDVLERDNNTLEYGEKLKLKVKYRCLEDGRDIYVRCIVRTPNHTAVGTTMSGAVAKCRKSEKEESLVLELDTSLIAPGKYVVTIVLFDLVAPGKQDKYDTAYVAVGFEVVATKGEFLGWKWQGVGWGYTAYPDIMVSKGE